MARGSRMSVCRHLRCEFDLVCINELFSNAWWDVLGPLGFVSMPSSEPAMMGSGTTSAGSRVSSILGWLSSRTSGELIVLGRPSKKWRIKAH